MGPWPKQQFQLVSNIVSESQCPSNVIKAAIINIVIFTMDQITVCNVKGVTLIDETQNYHLTLQFPSYQWSSHSLISVRQLLPTEHCTCPTS